MDNEILIPKLGWSIDEATFVEWLKSNGEYVNSGDELFSVESDKAIQTVESIDSGWLCIENNLPKEGQLLKYGTVIGYLSEKKTNSKVSIKLENYEDSELEKKTEDADEKTKNKVDDLDYKSSIREGENELIASDKSSTYKNSLNGLPDPHMLNLSSLLIFALCILNISPGMT